jgi:integrase
MTMQSHPLHKQSTLKAFAVRRDPYWGAPIARGRFVGYRKIAADRATWIARFRNEAGKQQFRSLGYATPEFGYDQAKTQAQSWFTELETGSTGTADSRTDVNDACKAYVAHLLRVSGKDSAHDAEMRFRRTIYGTPFGATPLRTLRLVRVKLWRDELKEKSGEPMKAPNSNRTLTALKAAINLAVEGRLWLAPLALELRRVKPMKHVVKRRDVYLDLKQRRALLSMAGDGAFHDLLEGAALTGARPGELAKAKCSQFDSRTKCMTFIGKTRMTVVPRTVPLAAEAVKLFTRLGKGRDGEEFLFRRDDGRHWDRSDWDQLVRAAAMAAKLPKKTVLYTLRHSWITEALMSGMNAFDVSKLTGTSLKMIEEHYGHLVAGAARARLATIKIL